MIGWKKVRIYDAEGFYTGRCAILKLDITGQVVRPEKEAEITSDRGHTNYVTKFRTDRLTVLAAFRPRTNQPVVLKKGERLGAIRWDHNDYTYKVGKVQRPSNRFVKNPLRDCAAGLHYFITRAHAEAWDR